MKILFDFPLKEKILNSDGTTSEKVRIFAICKPSSALKQKSEVFLAKTVSDLVAQGVLTRQMLQKRLINDGGVLSEIEKQETKKLFETYFENRDKLDKLVIIPEQDRTEAQKEEFAKLSENLAINVALIQEFERSQEALFNNTAENISRNRHIFWWILNTIYEKVSDKYLEVFGSGDFEKKQEVYDDLLENSFYREKLFPYAAEFVTAWYLNKAVNREDFQRIFESINADLEKIEDTSKKEAENVNK